MVIQAIAFDFMTNDKGSSDTTATIYTKIICITKMLADIVNLISSLAVMHDRFQITERRVEQRLQ